MMVVKGVVCMLLVTYVSAHSMLLCFDNGGLTATQLTLASGKNPCNAYPRGREKYDQQGDGFTNRPGDVCGTPFGTAYPTKYPASEIAAGQKFYPEWAARNHAGTPNAGNVQFFLSPVNPTADPSQSVFNQNKICDIDYSNCNQALGTNDAPCTGECLIPAGTAPGKYVVQWWWEFNAGEFYSNCADITVKAAGAGTGTTTGTVTSTPAATTTPTTPTIPPTVTPPTCLPCSCSCALAPSNNTAEAVKADSNGDQPIACKIDSDCPSGVCKSSGYCMAKPGIGAGGVAAIIFALLFAATAAALVVGFFLYKKK